MMIDCLVMRRVSQLLCLRSESGFESPTRRQQGNKGAGPALYDRPRE